MHYTGVWNVHTLALDVTLMAQGQLGQPLQTTSLSPLGHVQQCHSSLYHIEHVATTINNQCVRLTPLATMKHGL